MSEEELRIAARQEIVDILDEAYAQIAALAPKYPIERDLFNIILSHIGEIEADWLDADVGDEDEDEGEDGAA